MSIPKNGRFFRFATWKFTELEVQQCLKLLNQTTWGFRTNPNLCIEAQKELTAQHLLVSSNLLTNLDWQTLQLRMFTGISWHPRNLEEFFFVCSIRTFDTFSWSVAPPKKNAPKISGIPWWTAPDFGWDRNSRCGAAFLIGDDLFCFFWLVVSTIFLTFFWDSWWSYWILKYIYTYNILFDVTGFQA